MAMRPIFRGFSINWFGIGTLFFGESLWWVRESLFDFFKFMIDLQNFKQLNQSFKGPMRQKRCQGCNVLSLLIIQKFEKKGNSRKSCQLPDSASRGVVFQSQISPRIQIQNWNNSKSSARDSWGTNFWKTPENLPHWHVPLSKVRLPSIEHMYFMCVNVGSCMMYLLIPVIIPPSTKSEVKMDFPSFRQCHMLDPKTWQCKERCIRSLLLCANLSTKSQYINIIFLTLCCGF
jgi:hypothetical protein